MYPLNFLTYPPYLLNNALNISTVFINQSMSESTKFQNIYVEKPFAVIFLEYYLSL